MTCIDIVVYCVATIYIIIAIVNLFFIFAYIKYLRQSSPKDKWKGYS